MFKFRTFMAITLLSLPFSALAAEDQNDACRAEPQYEFDKYTGCLVTWNDESGKREKKFIRQELTLLGCNTYCDPVELPRPGIFGLRADQPRSTSVTQSPSR